MITEPSRVASSPSDPALRRRVEFDTVGGEAVLALEVPARQDRELLGFFLQRAIHLFQLINASHGLKTNRKLERGSGLE